MVAALERADVFLFFEEEERRKKKSSDKPKAATLIADTACLIGQGARHPAGYPQNLFTLFTPRTTQQLCRQGL
jgi:hypothetical protein